MNRQTKYFYFFILFLIGTIKAMSQDFPPNPLEKKGYTLEFNDEFKSEKIDTTKWIPFYLPQWSSRAKSVPNYSIENGTLILQITKDQEPWCPEYNGDVKVSSLQTGLFSGKKGSKIGQHRFNPKCIVKEEQPLKKTYTPKYGYFEIRAKAVKSSNNIVALWMIGFEDHPSKSGEICIMEVKGEHVTKDKTINGFGIHPFGDSKLKDEFYEEAFDINGEAYNIYAAEWKPDRIDFYINNKKVKTIFQSPDYEMQFMLNIYEVPVANLLENLDQTYPKCAEIDYVRGYRANK